jgi:hypothetical protein
LAAQAQQLALPAIGFLDPRTPEVVAARLRGFRQGLKESGYVEGENVSIVYGWADDQIDRLSSLAVDLVRRPVAAIVTSGPPIANSTRSLQHWGQPPEATPSILTWINADCDRVVGIMSRVFTAQEAVPR